VLAELALRRGIDLEINWIGRIAVFLVFGCVFLSMLFDWWLIDVTFVVAVAMSIGATAVYVRAARVAAGRQLQPSTST
jgi:hypothetical protein